MSAPTHVPQRAGEETVTGWERLREGADRAAALVLATVAWHFLLISLHPAVCVYVYVCVCVQSLGFTVICLLGLRLAA